MDSKVGRGRRSARDILLAVAAVVFACGTIVANGEFVFADLGWDEPSDLYYVHSGLSGLHSLFWFAGSVVFMVALLGRERSRDRRLWSAARVLVLASLIALAAAVAAFFDIPDLYQTPFINDWFNSGFRLMFAGAGADSLLTVVGLVLVARAFNPAADAYLRRRRVGQAFAAFGLGTALMLVLTVWGQHHLYLDSLPGVWMAYIVGALWSAAAAVGAWAFFNSAEGGQDLWQARLGRREGRLALAALLWLLGSAIGFASVVYYQGTLLEDYSVFSAVEGGLSVAAGLLVTIAFFLSRRSLVGRVPGIFAAEGVEPL